MVRFYSVALAGIVLAIGMSAHETVRLQSGYSFEADSHSEDQGIVLFKIGVGTMQIASDEIREIQMVADDPKPRPAAPDATSESPNDILGRAARAQGVDETFLRSVAKIESGLRQNALSPKGARGLMQLMPGTAAELKVDATRPVGNALGGAMYLRQLLLHFKGDSVLALAAYNAGPGTVAKFGGIPPYVETRTYILKVLAEYKSQLRSASNGALAIRKPDVVN